ncbi:MAG: hypothetical protein O6761_05850 [Thaumarchaeota archaeon]|nr:hypothetical protein [Nitrososphaerota archaeon]
MSDDTKIKKCIFCGDAVFILGDKDNGASPKFTKYIRWYEDE